MQTTFFSTMVPSVSQSTTAPASNKGTINVESSKSKSFANVLSGSVKASQVTASSPSASASSDTKVDQSNPHSEVPEQNLTRHTTTGQSGVAAKENLSNDSMVDEPVADDRTTETTPHVDSSALLMMMLQTNNLVVASQASPIGATVVGPVPTAGQTAIGNAVDTQSAFLQMVAAQTKGTTTTSTADFAAAISTLSDNNGSLTSEQLTQALGQFTEKSQAAEPITSGDAQLISTGAQANNVSIETALNQPSLMDTSKTDLTPSVSLMKANNVSIETTLNQPSLMDASKTDSTSSVSLMKANNVSIETATALAQSSLDGDVATQPLATDTDKQLQNSNPVLAAFQTQLASKFTVERQGSLHNAKTGVKAVDAAKNDLSSITSLVDAISENKAATTTSTQEHNTLQFDMNQLSQTSSDRHSSNVSEPTLGTFAQALNREQGLSSTAAVNANASQQGTVSKDSFQVMQQIVDQAKLITRAQNTEMVIKLKPEHLGELTLKITVEQGQVNATFHSNNGDVRSVIESSLSQLKQDLASSGLKVDNVGVYTGLDQSMSNQQNHSQNQQQLKFTRKGAADNFDDVAQLVEENQSIDTDGVDYRI